MLGDTLAVVGARGPTRAGDAVGGGMGDLATGGGTGDFSTGGGTGDLSTGVGRGDLSTTGAAAGDLAGEEDPFWVEGAGVASAGGEVVVAFNGCVTGGRGSEGGLTEGAAAGVGATGAAAGAGATGPLGTAAGGAGAGGVDAAAVGVAELFIIEFSQNQSDFVLILWHRLPRNA